MLINPLITPAVLLIFIFTSCQRAHVPLEIKVMTYNIRFASFEGTPYDWDFRKAGVVNLIEGFDFAGLQEVVPAQQDYIAKNLSAEYGSIFRTREGNPAVGEGAPLLFNKSQWDIIDSGTFWLSDTPDEPGSNTWEAAFARVATFGLFMSKANRKDTILVINTHFDHVSQNARLKSIELIHSHFPDIAASIPTLLIGDFNVTDQNEVYKYITREMALKDAWLEAGGTTDSTSFTFHGWKSETGFNRIDYIFYSNAFTVKEAMVHKDKRNSMYPSDHFPVSAVLSLRRR